MILDEQDPHRQARGEVAALEREDYDLVLMDVRMPGMDGLEATRLVRERRGTATRPWIVGLTADATLERRDQCLAAGMNDYLTKPVLPETLARAICAVRAVPS